MNRLKMELKDLGLFILVALFFYVLVSGLHGLLYG